MEMKRARQFYKRNKILIKKCHTRSQENGRDQTEARVTETSAEATKSMKRDNLTKLRVPLAKIEVEKEIGVNRKNSAKRVRRSGEVSKAKLNN